jgi:nitrate/nitrite-specific signal transduction histidine kinase
MDAATSPSPGTGAIRRPWRSLRGKSLLAVLVPLSAVLVLVAAGGPIIIDRVAERVVTQRDTELARIAADRLSERLQVQTALLQEVAQLSSVRAGSRGNLETIEDVFASSRSGRLAGFDMGLLLFSESGSIVASDPPWLARFPQWAEYPDRSQLRTVQSVRSPAYSSVFRDPINGLRFVMIAVPVIDVRGALSGVLAGAITLDGVVLRDLADVRTGSSGSAYLVDDHGSAVFHANPDLIGRTLRMLPAVIEASDGGSGAIIAPGSAGSETVSGFASVEGTGWVLITEENWDTVVAPIRRTGQVILGMVSFGGLVAIASLYALTTRMLRPIDRLVEGADRIAAGDFEHRVETESDEELRLLGERFNAMAGALDDSYTLLEARVEERTAENRQLYEEAAARAEELAELNRRATAVAVVAQRIGTLTSLDTLIQAVSSLLRETFGYAVTDIYLLDDASDELVEAGEPTADGTDRLQPRRVLPGDGLIGRAASERRTMIEGEEEGAAGLGNAMAVPIRSGDLIVGVLDIRAAKQGVLTAADQFTAETFADQLAVAVENARLFGQTRDLAVLEERNRFAREIHDTIAQGLTAVVLQLEALEASMQSRPEMALEHLTRARDLTRTALQEARRSVWNLLPEKLAGNSLDEALDREVTRFNASGPEAASVVVRGRPRALRSDVQTAVLRIAQEALNNARKHAGASSIEVQLGYLPGAVQLKVSDDGRGIADSPVVPSEGGGFGLRSMQTRAEQLFGTVKVQRAEAGAGTVVEAIIPAD